MLSAPTLGEFPCKAYYRKNPFTYFSVLAFALTELIAFGFIVLHLPSIGLLLTIGSSGYFVFWAKYSIGMQSGCVRFDKYVIKYTSKDGTLHVEVPQSAVSYSIIGNQNLRLCFPRKRHAYGVGLEILIERGSSTEIPKDVPLLDSA
jgi:hypothetical protein